MWIPKSRFSPTTISLIAFSISFAASAIVIRKTLHRYLQAQHKATPEPQEAEMPSNTAQSQSVDVAIVGGGIIGLVLALGLLKRDIKVKIYEQSRSFREIGAGVAFTANAIRCMHIVNPDIVDALRAVATSNGDADNPNDWLQWIDGYNQKSEDPHDEQILFKLYAGYRGFEGCHRAHFLDELVKRIPEGIVEFRKRLDEISDQGTGEKLLLKFHDGTTARADASKCAIFNEDLTERADRLVIMKSLAAMVSNPGYEKFSWAKRILPPTLITPTKLHTEGLSPWKRLLKRWEIGMPAINTCT